MTNQPALYFFSADLVVNQPSCRTKFTYNDDLLRLLEQPSRTRRWMVTFCSIGVVWSVFWCRKQKSGSNELLFGRYIVYICRYECAIASMYGIPTWIVDFKCRYECVNIYIYYYVCTTHIIMILHAPPPNTGGHQNHVYKDTLPPTNICFLSFRVIFHFHDYGRKGMFHEFWIISWISTQGFNPFNKWKDQHLKNSNDTRLG